MRQSAFTLVELLMVVAIIAVLAALLLPAITTIREKATRVNCMSRLRSWAMGLEGYAQDNRGQLPASKYSSTNLGVNFEPAHMWVSIQPQQHKKDEISVEMMRNYMPDNVGSNGSRFAFSKAWGCPRALDQLANRHVWWMGTYIAPHLEFPGYMYFAQRSRSTLPAVRDNIHLADRERDSQRILMSDTCWNWNTTSWKSTHVRGGSIMGVNQLFGDGHVAWKHLSTDDNVAIKARTATATSMQIAATRYYY